MRILTVSNLYPPIYLGGYELGCRDMMEALTRRGHDIHVLTSDYVPRRQPPPEVENSARVTRRLRCLVDWDDLTKPVPDGYSRLSFEAHNRRVLQEACRRIRPDIVYFWNLGHLPISLAYHAQEMGFPTAFYVFDHWMKGIAWDSWYYKWRTRHEGGVRRLPQRAVIAGFNLAGLAPFRSALRLGNSQFASAFLLREAREAGLDLAEAQVCHWGIAPDEYEYRQRSGPARRFLYVGQVVPNKGVHTIIEAMALLKRRLGALPMDLTIVGGCALPEYMDSLHATVADAGIEEHVTFAGKRPRADLRRIYSAHDALIFSSVWDEPFGITLLEAMASGLAVAGTGTGGSAEIFEKSAHRLVYPPGDVDGCADCLLRLTSDCVLFETLAHAGRQTVETHFRFSATVDRVEQMLLRAAGSAVPPTDTTTITATPARRDGAAVA